MALTQAQRRYPRGYMYVATLACSIKAASILMPPRNVPRACTLHAAAKESKLPACQGDAWLHACPQALRTHSIDLPGLCSFAPWENYLFSFTMSPPELGIYETVWRRMRKPDRIAAPWPIARARIDSHYSEPARVEFLQIFKKVVYVWYTSAMSKCILPK